MLKQMNFLIYKPELLPHVPKISSANENEL